MLSSAGLTPQIRRLTQDKLPLELAVSLHATNDELRSRLVPINRKYPLVELLAACRDYTNATGRLVYVEYVLFSGINYSIVDADALLKLLKGLPSAVNLIVGNPSCSLEYLPTSRKIALAFQNRLIAGGMRTMLRVSRGADIEAGCGQLRSRYISKLTKES
jgi:23S rRNA (adenine2503-C2)-methyltransferase